MPPEIEDLGRAAYPAVLARMRELHAQVHAGAISGRILFVEHDPVYTAGRATKAGDCGPEIVPIERGGKITFHGHGQLVVYPIVRLPRHDLRDWLRRFEAFGVALCAAFGLAAEPSVDGTGVFVNGRKVASIGVAVKHWISLHGISINVAMDLTPFFAVRPCGLAPEIMSDLSTAAARAITLEEVKAAARAMVFVHLAPRNPV
ncbi:MAG: lipoyl(octanoyl) transferase [Planctomycetes bacterium]|nr:lipoyl(octanoyl) transferase [Planctomycetota bacterium]